MSYKDRFPKLNLLPLRYRMDLKDLVLIFKGKAIKTSTCEPKNTIATAMHAKFLKLKLPYTLCKTKLFKTLILL